MKINYYFLGLALLFVILIGVGYVIMNPQDFGLCKNIDQRTFCFGSDVHFGIGKTMYGSLYPYLIIFIVLTFVPLKFLKYWFRIVLPLMMLSVLVAFLASSSRQNMFDLSRSEVVYEAGMYLLVLSALTISFEFSKEFIARRITGKGAK